MIFPLLKIRFFCLPVPISRKSAFTVRRAISARFTWTVVIFDYIKKRRPDILKKLKVIGPEEEERIEEAGVA